MFFAPFAVAVTFAVLAAQDAPATKGADVLRYELRVTIRDDGLAVEVGIHVRGPVPAKWVVNDQAQADPQQLAATLTALRGLLQKGAVSGGEAAVCHTGIGHCLFRQGKLDEAGAVARGKLFLEQVYRGYQQDG